MGRLLKAIDDERIELGAALGLEIENDPHISIRQGYLAEENYDKAYSTAPGFLGIKAQTQLDYRYYNEDAGFGLVLWVDLADRLGLELPNVRAMLQIVSSIMGRDYKAEKARTLDGRIAADPLILANRKTFYTGKRSPLRRSFLLFRNPESMQKTAEKC